MSHAVNDAACQPSEAILHTVDGQSSSVHIEHTYGPVDNPMTGGAMDGKFTASATPVVGADAAASGSEAIRAFDQQWPGPATAERQPGITA